MRSSTMALALAMWMGACAGWDVSAQDLSGVFVGTADGPQELGVYTNRTPVGLRLAVGTLDEVHMVPGLVRLLCNLPFWRPRSAFIATGRILRDDRAPRRPMALRARQLTITAYTVDVVGTEDPASLKPLLDAVGASPENPAYVFVTMESKGTVRDYLIGIVFDP